MQVQTGSLSDPGPQPAKQRRAILLGLSLLGLGMMGLALLLAPPEEVMQGWGRILASPNVLISDSKAVGGMAAAFWNAGLMTLLSLCLILLLKAEISGPAIAAVMIVCGFSFFGKNPLNTLPVVAGALLFFRLAGEGMAGAAVPTLFSTALGPLVSSVALGMGLPPAFSIPLAILLGLSAGFLLIPISRKALSFHAGYNLYNIGFAAGLTAMLLVNLLRLFDLEIPSAMLLHPGGGWPLALGLALLFLGLAWLGWRLNGRGLRGYLALMQESGRLGSNDFVKTHGLGLSLFNCGLSSLLALAIVLLAGAPLNGPVLGSLLTITGFAFYGKHPRNILPLMAGALVGTLLSFHKIQATHAMIVVMFSTTLAPLAGGFGPLIGFLAGILHAAVAHNSSFLHGGVNLYNNGFAGGLVAGLMVAVMDALALIRRARHPQPPSAS
ncbi:MAG: DUF1576 domain-containing protein [Christensenellales bacterium]